MTPGIRITLAESSPEPSYTGGPFDSGMAQMVIGDATTGWMKDYLTSADPVGDRVDISRGGNYAQMLDTEIQISNHGQWFEIAAAAGVSFYAAKVEFCSLIYSITEYSATPLWTGTITDVFPEGGCIRVRIESIVAKIHKEIPARKITSQEFPGISSDADGKVVPIIYGSVEGLTPPSIKSTQYMAAAYRVSELGKYDSELASVPCLSAALNAFTAPYMIATGSAQSLPASDFYTSVDENFDVESWYPIAWDRDVFYIEVTSGTGSGQTRKVTGSIATVSILNANSCTTYCATCGIASPWDTIPDTTSTFRFYTIPVAEVLIVGDEATVTRTYAIEAKEEFDIPAAQGTVSGVVTSDVSGEFRNGENYSAVSYVAPAQNYGSPKLTDRKSANVPANKNTINILPCNFGSIGLMYPCDAFCRTKMFCSEFPKGTEEQTEIDCLFSFESAPISANDVKMILIGEYLDGTEVVIKDAQLSATTKNGTSFSNYSPSICSDAAFGDYSGYSIRVGLPRPVSAFASFRACLLLPDGWGAFDQGLSKCLYAEGSTTITIVASGVPYTFEAGDLIRPWSAFDLTASEFDRDILAATFRADYGYQYIAYAGPYSEWRTILSVTPVSSGYQIVISSPFNVASGNYAITAVKATAPFKPISEIEAGFAFVYGEVSPDSEFRVDVSSGRTSSSVPITLARDAASNLFASELPISIDSASFAALQGDAIHSALTERENSADVIARWCEQFNWVISHNGTGDAVAKAPFASVGTEEYDYEFDTGAMIDGSIPGLDITDVVDIINVPTVSWDYTQADGYRQTACVSDISAAPSTLDASNYLATLSGWGDFAVSLEIYGKLHESFVQYAYRQSGTLEYPDAGEDISALLFPPSGISRLDWVASRKIVLTFSVPETLLPSGIVIGSRIKARHKRYTSNAWKYGTLVEWKWDMMGGRFDLKIMLDPSLTSDVPELYIDTIDASGATEQYIDQRDGTTEQYIEVIA